MRWRLAFWGPALLTFGAVGFPRSMYAQQPVAMKIAAPELKGIEEWINTKPVRLKDLRGKVVALHFWTFG